MKTIFASSLTVILYCLLFLRIRFSAKVKLPAIFGDNMVLQQKTDAAIWGTAEKNATVKVITSWNNKTLYIKTRRRWKMESESCHTCRPEGHMNISITDGKIR